MRQGYLHYYLLYNILPIVLWRHYDRIVCIKHHQESIFVKYNLPYFLLCYQFFIWASRIHVRPLSLFIQLLRNSNTEIAILSDFNIIIRTNSNCLSSSSTSTNTCDSTSSSSCTKTSHNSRASCIVCIQ